MNRQSAIDDLTRRGYEGVYSKPSKAAYFPGHGKRRDGCRPCLLHGLLDAHLFNIGGRGLVCSGCAHF